MLIDGVTLVEGSEINNATVASGTSFPGSPSAGELFFRTDLVALHVYTGSTWVQVGLSTSQLEGQPGSYYLDLANHTGVLAIANGGTAATTTTQARANLGLVINTDVQAYSTELAAIAAVSGTGTLRRTAPNTWSFDTTSYQPLNSDLTTILSLVGNGFLKKSAGSWILDTSTYLTQNQTITLSGDVSGSGTTAITATLATVNANTGSFGAATTVPVITVNGKGLITAVSTATVPTSLTFTGDATGSGSVGSSTALTLATVNANVGSFGSASSVGTFTVNGKGLITAAGSTSIAIATSQITSGTFADARIAASNVTQHQAALTILETQITDGSLLARNAGNETITGSWSFSNPVSVATPSSSSHAATKQYVDDVASGMNVHLACRVATTANLTATYNNGTSGVGATLTGTGALPTIDGVTLAVNDRVLVKNQTTQTQNGIYVVTQTTTNWILTRASDFDNSPVGEIIAGDTTFIQEGTQASTQWVQTTTGTLTIGTSNIVFTQFGGPGTYVAGAGLTLTGTTFAVGTASAARIVVNADNLDLATTGVSASTYRSVTVDAYGRVTAGTNPTTLSGYGITDAQPLNANLTGLSGVSTTGIEIRTGAGTYTTRSLAVSGTGLGVSNADGIAGNPTVTSNATSANTASTIVARDASGNFVAGTITASLTGAASSNVLKAGDTMTGALIINTGTVQPLSLRTSSTSPWGLELLRTDTSFSSKIYNDGTRLYFEHRPSFAGNTPLDSANYNSYSPTLTGTGASGTWSINITGNAATATSATSASNSSQLGGYAASTSQAINTIPVRDASGYVFFNYINSNTSNGENPTVSQVIVTNGTDNYYRKSSIASFTSAVQSNASGTWAINISGNANSANSATSVSNSVTFNNAGTGAASGTTYNGGTAQTISYNTIGAPSTTGTNASGTWAINVTGSAGSVDWANVTNKPAGSSYSSFTSAEQALPTTNGVYTVAHGGSTVPTMFSVVMRCKTADLGYSPGDEYSLMSDQSDSGSQAEGVYVNASVIGLVHVHGNVAPAIRNRTTGTFTNVTAANWRLVYRCFWL